MNRLVLILGVLLIAGCGQHSIRNVDGLAQETAVPRRADFPYDSIHGCWGTHPETGNSILCFVNNDSVFWVDPSLWCTYSIENDTVTMLLDTLVYLKGRIEYRNDTLLISDNDFVWKYERFNE